MKQEKRCLVCKKLFKKGINCSKQRWLLKKFCSRECTNISFIGKANTSKTKFFKGHTPYNKGLKCLEISGDKHGMWKGGRLKKINGYIFIHNPNHPNSDTMGYVREHRLIMEEFLGRYLEPKEVVHHINEIKDDNRLENLLLFTNNGEHTRYHRLYL